jgi:hypothetical protein
MLLMREWDSQAAADITALSTTAHGNGLGGHLLSLALRIVSCKLMN